MKIGIFFIHLVSLNIDVEMVNTNNRKRIQQDN